ncbi:MAG: ABC transporter permease [Caldimonas sp.]
MRRFARSLSWRQTTAWTAIALLAALLLLPQYVRVDPQEPSARAFLVPSLAHPFGTDDLGRDLLIALVFGGRASLISGGLVTVGATLLGLAIGVLAGVAGAGTDRLLTRLMDASQIVPRFFLALLASAWLGPGWIQLAVILALTGWATLARLVRAESRSLRSAPFVEAALLLGASRASVALRHLIPNMLPLALPQVPLIFSSALLIEAGLSFLGAGDPNRLTWGTLVRSGQTHALRAWWLVLFPGLSLALVCAALTLVALIASKSAYGRRTLDL